MFPSIFFFLLTILTVCQVGCSLCADHTATCLACEKGFTRDPTDETKCSPSPAGGTTCPKGLYSTGEHCASCSFSCQTCTGPSSNNCITCPNGKSLFQSNCVGTDFNGVCEGSNGMIADNVKQECDGEIIYYSLTGP
jgi:hypothetical protein